MTIRRKIASRTNQGKGGFRSHNKVKRQQQRSLAMIDISSINVLCYQSAISDIVNLAKKSYFSFSICCCFFNKINPDFLVLFKP